MGDLLRFEPRGWRIPVDAITSSPQRSERAPFSKYWQMRRLFCEIMPTDYRRALSNCRPNAKRPGRKPPSDTGFLSSRRRPGLHRAMGTGLRRVTDVRW